MLVVSAKFQAIDTGLSSLEYCVLIHLCGHTISFACSFVGKEDNLILILWI